VSEPSGRAVPYACPFCAEEDLRPVPEGRWHCRSCLRVFSISYYGLRAAGADAADLSAISSGKDEA
jgi:ribosomal protein L37AE/L43A